MTVYMAGPDGATKEFADKAEAAELRRAQREAEPQLLGLLRKRHAEVLSLKQMAGRASIDRRGRGEALRDLENALRWLADWMEHDIDQAVREGALADAGSTDPRERSANVTGIGTVRVRGAHCGCGRPIEPRDFERTNDGAVRVICSHCHSDPILFELDAVELDHDEA